MAGVLDIDSEDFDAKAFVNDIAQRGQAADEDTVWQKLYDKQEADQMFPGDSAEKAWGFIKKLPKNVSVGTTNAGLAMVGLMDDINNAAARLASRIPGASPELKQYAHQLEHPEVKKVFSESALPPSVLKPVVAWRDEMTRNNVFEDDLTQGIAQFVVPFSMFSKMANVSKAQSLLGTIGRVGAAEAATVGTAFGPHDMRGADLLELGREAENKFGDVMRKATPDGSLANAYINYMTDREDEGPWEGRFKNIVDSLAVSAATAGLLKAAPFALKAGRYAAENAATGPTFGSKAAQGGWVGFHGTPHKVEKFDINKIGTGEGNQTYGHGLYFAENKDVANTYRQRLTRGRNPVGSAAMYAEQAMSAAKGDATAAYKALVQRAADDTVGEANKYRVAADLVKSGNAAPRGELITVEIPDEVVAKMIDFDKPMTAQKQVLDKVPAEDRAKLEAYLEDNNQPALEDLTGNEFQQLIGKAIQNDVLGFVPADGVFDSSRKLAAEYLNGIDIPGVRYLDGGSRKGSPAANEGTRNLVLFDDKHVKIKGKE